MGKRKDNFLYLGYWDCHFSFYDPWDTELYQNLSSPISPSSLRLLSNLWRWQGYCLLHQWQCSITSIPAIFARLRECHAGTWLQGDATCPHWSSFRIIKVSPDCQFPWRKWQLGRAASEFMASHPCQAPSTPVYPGTAPKFQECPKPQLATLLKYF